MYDSERRTAVGAAWAGLIGGVLGLLTQQLLDRAEVDVSVAYAVGIGATSAILIVVLRALALSLDIVPSRRGVTERVVASPDPVLAPWERRLGTAARDRRVFVAAVQPELRDLARDRIRLHRELDLNELLLDPGRARQILGADLWHWLTTTDRDGTPPTPNQLQAMIEAVGSL